MATYQTTRYSTVQHLSAQTSSRRKNASRNAITAAMIYNVLIVVVCSDVMARIGDAIRSKIQEPATATAVLGPPPQPGSLPGYGLVGPEQVPSNADIGSAFSSFGSSANQMANQAAHSAAQGVIDQFAPPAQTKGGH